MSQRNRVFTTEFRVQVAQRILDGESVSKIHHELAIKRSVLYRWRDQYRKAGAAGLNRTSGRPAGVPNPAAAPHPGRSAEETLRRQIAELERKIGQQHSQSRD